jgi:hypothetical protein
VIREGKTVRVGDVMMLPDRVPPAVEQLHKHFCELTATYAAKIGVRPEVLRAVSFNFSMYVWDAANHSRHSDSEILDEIIAYWQQAATTHGPDTNLLPLPIAVGCALMLLETRRVNALRDEEPPRKAAAAVPRHGRHSRH